MMLKSFFHREETSIDVLLLVHKAEVVQNDYIFHLVIRRKHVLEDAMHYFRKNEGLDGKLKVTFVGEPAVDEGEYWNWAKRMHVATMNSVSSMHANVIKISLCDLSNITGGPLREEFVKRQCFIHRNRNWWTSTCFSEEVVLVQWYRFQ